MQQKNVNSVCVFGSQQRAIALQGGMEENRPAF